MLVFFFDKIVICVSRLCASYFESVGCVINCCMLCTPFCSGEGKAELYIKEVIRFSLAQILYILRSTSQMQVYVMLQ